MGIRLARVSKKYSNSNKTQRDRNNLREFVNTQGVSDTSGYNDTTASPEEKPIKSFAPTDVVADETSRVQESKTSKKKTNSRPRSFSFKKWVKNNGGIIAVIGGALVIISTIVSVTIYIANLKNDIINGSKDIEINRQNISSLHNTSIEQGKQLAGHSEAIQSIKDIVFGRRDKQK